MLPAVDIWVGVWWCVCVCVGGGGAGGYKMCMVSLTCCVLMHDVTDPVVLCVDA